MTHYLFALLVILAGCTTTKPDPDPQARNLHQVLRIYCIDGRAYSRMMDALSDPSLMPMASDCRLIPYVEREIWPQHDPMPRRRPSVRYGT